MTPVQVIRLEPNDKWTNGLLDRVFDGTLWRTDLRFEVVEMEHSVRDRPAVVVVPGEEWAGSLPDLNAFLARFPRVVVAVIADEGSSFPAWDLEHPDLRLWVQTPRPGVHPPGVARYFGFGWRYDVPDILEKIGRRERTLEWFYAGQVNHGRRTSLVEVLRRFHPDGLLLTTKGFARGYGAQRYLEETARAKWVPCPSGPLCVDSFRFYEALEAGAVPILDGECPGYPEGVSGADYWRLVYGPEFPVPIAPEWKVLEDAEPGALHLEGFGGPFLSAWWQQTKRALAWDMRDDAGGLERGTPHDGISVVVSMSPIPSHPSLEILDETLASIRERLPDVETFVCADGWHDGSACSRADYVEALSLLAHRCEHEWDGVVPLISNRWEHQANTLRRALEQVRTSCVLFVEHDTPLCGDPIPWGPLLQAIHAGEANVVRFSSEASVLEPWRHLYLEPDEPFDLYGAPALRTVQWSSRPHLAGVTWYRRILDTYFAPESRTYTEDVLHGVVQAAHKARGEDGWREWRIWTYAPPGDLKRSTHTDGRAGAPKGDERLVFAYPGGGTPPGAPRATRDRIS